MNRKLEEDNGWKQRTSLSIHQIIELLTFCIYTRKHSATLQILREDYSFRYPSLYVARYSCIQLSELWDGRKWQSFETAAIGFVPGFSRLRARSSKRYATAPRYIQRTILQTEAWCEHGIVEVTHVKATLRPTTTVSGFLTSQTKSRRQSLHTRRWKSERLPLPYVRNLSEKLTTISRQYEVGTYHKPYNTIRPMVVHPKDKTQKQEVRCDI